MVVGQEDLVELHEPDRRAQELALRPLAAVEEQPLAPAPDEQRGRRPPRGRHRARGAEKDEVEIHAPSLGAPAELPALSAGSSRHLARDDRGAAGEVVPLLDLPDRLARVAPVPAVAIAQSVSPGCTT